MQNSNCDSLSEHGDDWDGLLYKEIDEEMGNCTAPWSKNNSRICNDTKSMKKAGDIYWSKLYVSLLHIFTWSHNKKYVL